MFRKDIKLVAQKNIQIMKTCSIIVVSKLRVVLQMYLQTISSVLLSDGHLKPVCVFKFNVGSLHIIMNIDHSLGCRLVLSNCWYESYLRALERVSFEHPMKLCTVIVLLTAYQNT